MWSAYSSAKSKRIKEGQSRECGNVNSEYGAGDKLSEPSEEESEKVRRRSRPERAREGSKQARPEPWREIGEQW